MRMTSKGQVTIPQHLRERFGLAPNSDVEFSPAKDGVLIKPAQSAGDSPWRVTSTLDGLISR